ncbi:MAG: sugar transferase [Armatimonadota bacterium]|nr:sugar transferase [Armatimonadota bacterium]
MPRRARRALVLALVGVDGVAVAAALVAAYWLAADQWSTWSGAALLLAVGVPGALAVFGLHRLYVVDELLEGPTEYGRVIYACTLAALGLIVLGFWTRLGDVARSRRLVILVWLLSIVAVGVGRFLARRAVRFIRRRGGLASRTVIVGLGTAGLSLARHFADLKHAGVRVVGFVDDFLPAGTPVMDGLQVLGPPSALPRILAETAADEIIVVPTAMAWESFRDLFRGGMTLNGTAVRVSPAIRDVVTANVKVHQRGFLPFLTLERFRITGLDAVLKGTMDYVLALGALPMALPLLAAAAAALVATRVRPFRSVPMVGRGGGAFRALVLDVGEVGDSQTAVQRLLYRLGLDRLPLLLNVLGGQMSVVGPRPIPVERRAAYEPWMPNLLMVKPGITGAWALQDGPVSVDEEMRANLFYIRNYTIWLDLELLARSLLRLLGGRRSQRAAEVGTRESVAVH